MSSKDYGAMLESRGWKREVAKGDFDLGCRIAEAVLGGPTKRGLILSGNYGSGKTSFVKALLPNAQMYSMPHQEGVFDLDYQVPQGNPVVLDDIGAEHSVNEYGIRKEPFADFVVQWHARREGLGRLVITTNLSIKEFEERYGGRVVSRLKELCVAARFNGGDKREWTVIK